MLQHKKSFCSPLNGDFGLCQEVGEELTSTVDSFAFLSISLRFFVSSTCFTTGLETFAFPLAGMQMQPQWKQMRDVRKHKQGRDFQRDYTAVWFRSLARGDLFAGEVSNAEATIPGSNRGVTTLGSEGNPTLSSVDRNQHFCSRQTPNDPS